MSIFHCLTRVINFYCIIICICRIKWNSILVISSFKSKIIYRWSISIIFRSYIPQATSTRNQFQIFIDFIISYIRLHIIEELVLNSIKIFCTAFIILSRPTCITNKCIVRITIQILIRIWLIWLTTHIHRIKFNNSIKTMCKSCSIKGNIHITSGYQVVHLIYTSTSYENIAVLLRKMYIYRYLTVL